MRTPRLDIAAFDRLRHIHRIYTATVAKAQAVVPRLIGDLEAREVTQPAIATALGVATQSVSHAKNGRLKLRPDNLLRLAALWEHEVEANGAEPTRRARQPAKKAKKAK